MKSESIQTHFGPKFCVGWRVDFNFKIAFLLQGEINTLPFSFEQHVSLDLCAGNNQPEDVLLALVMRKPSTVHGITVFKTDYIEMSALIC